MPLAEEHGLGSVRDARLRHVDPPPCFLQVVGQDWTHLVDLLLQGFLRLFAAHVSVVEEPLVD